MPTTSNPCLIGLTKCHYCKRETFKYRSLKGVSPPDDYRTVEHIIPRSRGGSSSPSNLTIACWKCNTEKGDLLLDEWRMLRAYRRVKKFCSKLVNRRARKA